MANKETRVAESATGALRLRQKVLPRLSETDLKNLRIFRVIAEHGGITQAALVLGTEKSNVSRSLAHLEERFDEKLCSRGPKGFELSKFGRSVLASAIMLGDAVEVARSEIMRARNTLTGTVRLAVIDSSLSNPQCHVPAVLREFTRLMPEVELRLQVVTVEGLYSALKERRVDMAIGDGGIRDSFLVHEPVFGEEAALFAMLGPDEPVPHVAQLRSRGMSLILREDERLNLAMPEALLNLNSRRLYASGLEAVAMLMQSGPYVGFLPVHYALQIRGTKVAREIRDAERFRFRSEFNLLYERDRPRTYPVQTLISMLLNPQFRQPPVGPDLKGSW